jgi:glycosyltransferase involved in cell wall biosynthesis
MKVFNVYRGFTEYGGAEAVVLTIHNSLKERNYESYVGGPDDLSKLHPGYHLHSREYVRLTLQNVRLLEGAVVLSHHRKMTAFLYLAKMLMGVRFRLIHVSHNEFHTLKNFTLLPKEVIAVSNRVKENLASYFKVKPERIKVIYNGLADVSPAASDQPPAARETTPGTIRVLYSGRITKVKRQAEVVQKLDGKLDARIQIHFAGTGEEFDVLKNLTKDSKTFKPLGFVSIKDTLPAYDYVMLFSTNEGLPLTLIEGCMFGKPLICNDVGGNLEILQDGFNGLAANSYDDLIGVLNNLPPPSSEAYQQLSSNARRVFEQKFRKERMINEYAGVINNPS